MPDFADVPTFKENGWDQVRYLWRGIVAKAGLPQPIMDRLAAAMEKSQQSSEWTTYMNQASQLDGFQSAAEFKQQLMTDISEMIAVKKKLGLR